MHDAQQIAGEGARTEYIDKIELHLTSSPSWHRIRPARMRGHQEMHRNRGILNSEQLDSSQSRPHSPP